MTSFELPDTRKRNVANPYAIVIRGACIAVGLLAVTVLCGWIFNIDILKNAAMGVSMKVNAAICFILVSISLFLYQLRQPRAKTRIHVSAYLLWIVAGIGIVSYSQEIMNYNLGIDETFIDDSDARVNGDPYPGRMSPITSICLTLVCLSLLTLESESKLKQSIAQGFLHVVTVIAFIAILGYFFAVPSLYALSFLSSISILAAIALFALSLAASLQRPSLGLTGLFGGSAIGNLMARKLFLQITTAVLLLTYAGLWIFRQAIVSVEYGLALLALSFILTSLFLIWRTANVLNSVDSHRVTAEDNLARVTRFLDSTPDPVIIVDAMGLIQLSNSQVENVLGYQKAELVGQRVEMLIPERLATNHPGHRQNYFQAPKVREMGAGLNLFARRKDKKEIPVEISLSPIHTETGNWVSVAIRDVTQRKEVEKKLEEYKFFFDNSTDLFCIANMEGYFEVLNPGFERVLGYSDAELREKQFLAFVHPDDIQGTLKEMDKLNQGSKTISFQNRYKKKDGDYLWFDWNSTPNLSTGKISAVARDVTQRKEEEERSKRYAILESKSKEMEQFVYIASHDLREPLITIKNFIEILIEDYGDDLKKEAKRYTQAILESALRMQTLVGGLLDYSRLSNVKEIQTVDCNQILKEVAADLHTLITDNKVTMTIHDLPTIKAYPLELKLLFQNLLNNGIKFKRKDTAPVLEVSAKKITEGWQFSVADNGIGIAEKDKKKIFVIFQRLHKSDEYPGTGIGLAHCKKIVEIHNGSIWLDSTPGLSSTFYFTILTDHL